MSDASTGQAAPSSFRLIYRSRSRIPAERRKAALGTLFSTARSKNKLADITGALLIKDDWFVQTLEGDETAVRALYARIESDPRHDSLALLQATLVDERVFSRWSMAELSEDPEEQDTFLIAHKDGISPAASLHPTTQQESVLRTMRAAARGEVRLPTQPAATSAERGTTGPPTRSGGPVSM